MKLRLILLVLFLAAASCSKEVPPATESQRSENEDANELVLVATNDFHAALDKAEGLASVIRDLRKRYGNRMVYLDAGDQFAGSFEGSMQKGKAVIEFYNLLRPDAAVLGNHEFDFGPENLSRVTLQPGDDPMGYLKKIVKESKFPMISANLIVDPPVSCTEGPECNALGFKTLFAPRVEFRRTAGKVCVIGVTTPLTRNITNPEFFEGTQFQDMKTVVMAEAARYRQKENCDWVVLLAHEGLRYENDGKTLKHTGLLPLLEAIPEGTVDAVVGGHSHAQVQQVIRGTPVIQSGSAGNAVGVLRLKRNGETRTHAFDPWIQVPDTAVAFDVTDRLMLYRSTALDHKRQIVATTTAPFLFDKTAETPLGNLVADAILDAGRPSAQFAMINSGAIRSNLHKGRISNENIYRLMPFDNTVVVAELTGKELRALLEIAFSGALGVPSISGLQVSMVRTLPGQTGAWSRDLNNDGRMEDWERKTLSEIRDARGNLLKDDQIYRFATISYLVAGGDYNDFVFDHVPPTRIHYMMDKHLRDVLADYFQRKSPLDPAHFFKKNQPRVLMQ